MPERILLYRPGFLGDLVMSMPAVRLVRQHNPDAHIVYATNPPCDQLLSMCPWIDEARKAGTYRHSDYDRMCHFSHEDFWPQSEYWGRLHVKNAQKAGLIPDDIVAGWSARPVLWLDTAQAPEAIFDSHFVLVHAHSTNGKNWRLWDMDKWDALTRKIDAETGLDIFQLGMGTDPVIPVCSERGTDLRGLHTVMQDMWMVAHATLCVCIDSFIAHVAHAEKIAADSPGDWQRQCPVPTVLLNGPIDPVCIVPQGSACEVVSDYSHCRRRGPCGHSHGPQMCESKNACMRELSVDCVWAAVEKVLDGVLT